MIINKETKRNVKYILIRCVMYSRGSWTKTKLIKELHHNVQQITTSKGFFKIH